jgi:hypothetical protein
MPGRTSLLKRTRAIAVHLRLRNKQGTRTEWSELLTVRLQPSNLPQQRACRRRE